MTTYEETVAQVDPTQTELCRLGAAIRNVDIRISDFM